MAAKKPAQLYSDSCKTKIRKKHSKERENVENKQNFNISSSLKLHSKSDNFPKDNASSLIPSPMEGTDKSSSEGSNGKHFSNNSKGGNRLFSIFSFRNPLAPKQKPLFSTSPPEVKYDPALVALLDRENEKGNDASFDLPCSIRLVPNTDKPEDNSSKSLEFPKKNESTSVLPFNEFMQQYSEEKKKTESPLNTGKVETDSFSSSSSSSSSFSSSSPVPPKTKSNKLDNSVAMEVEEVTIKDFSMKSNESEVESMETESSMKESKKNKTFRLARTLCEVFSKKHVNISQNNVFDVPNAKAASIYYTLYKNKLSSSHDLNTLMLTNQITQKDLYYLYKLPFYNNYEDYYYYYNHQNLNSGHSYDTNDTINKFHTLPSSTMFIFPLYTWIAFKCLKRFLNISFKDSIL